MDDSTDTKVLYQLFFRGLKKTTGTLSIIQQDLRSVKFTLSEATISVQNCHSWVVLCGTNLELHTRNDGQKLMTLLI